MVYISIYGNCYLYIFIQCTRLIVNSLNCIACVW